MTNLETLVDSSGKSPDGADPATTRPAPERGGRRGLRSSVIRFLQTARHLRARQAWYWAVRRGLGRRYRLPAPGVLGIRDNVGMAAELQLPPSALGESEFEFLNVRRRFADRIAWHDSGESKLWQYNLHYFDYALDPARSPDWIRATLEDWVRCNPPGASVGWEPYPVALRVVNWIKFDLHRGDGRRLPPSCELSLFQQLWWLERNLEHEIQANHLLKNAKALLYGGAYFSGRIADRWLRKGRRLFLQQIDEQFRPDGGHYERSAMYHAIALHDMLDVLSLASGSAKLMSGSVAELLPKRSRKALGYLEDLTFPGGRLPMINDSVAGIAPELDALRSYAAAIAPSLVARASSPAALINKPNAGFYGYRQGAEMLLVDGGGPSPPYQPGHSHCGLLGFELMVAGQPVIVDSGMHDYEAGALRHSLRSTEAHNTVRIDGEEQSDIWGAFRIGRRARPGSVSLSADIPRRFQFAGSHDGYRHRPGHPIHKRVIDCAVGSQWRITDRITGQGSHLVESFLHFHPSFRIGEQADHWLATCEEPSLRFRITTTGGACTRAPSTYCPRFGVRQTGWMLSLKSRCVLPAELTYTIEKI